MLCYRNETVIIKIFTIIKYAKHKREWDLLSSVMRRQVISKESSSYLLGSLQLQELFII